MRNFFWCLLAFLALTACAPDPPLETPTAGEPIAQQLLEKAPFLREARYSSMLDFESADDALFISANREGSIVNDRGFTGRASYRAGVNTDHVSIKVDSLLAGRPFPANWCMIGGFCFTRQATRIAIRFGELNREVDLPANSWTPVFIDLPASTHPTTLPTVAPLEFDLPTSHQSLWLDDVMMVDNQKSLLETSAGGWKLERRGTQINGNNEGQFNFSLDNSDLSKSGWNCDEANLMRARFSTAMGNTLTVYSDGRAFDNGVYKAMSAAVSDQSYALQHQHPASIEVSDTMGRVDRNTPGDANNDGYNETTGSYRIIATSPRIEMRFSPGLHAADPRPVLEISGLPFGKVLATLEGRLIDHSQRTSDGDVLVELPATIDRPATVDVRIEN